MTDETINTGWSSGSMVLIAVVFFLILFSFLGRGFGFGDRQGYTAPFIPNMGCAGHASNCEVMKQEIIDAAKTQYLVETTSRSTQDMLSAQMNNWRYEQLSSQLFDAKLNSVMQQNAANLALAEKNSTIERLQLASSVSSQFNDLNSKIDAIACKMAKAPEIATLSAACPAGAVVNPFTNCGNYNYV
jgi:hypothetical protein